MARKLRHKGGRPVQWRSTDRVAIMMRLNNEDAQLLRKIATLNGRFVQQQLERVIEAYLDRYREAPIIPKNVVPEKQRKTRLIHEGTEKEEMYE